MTQVKFTSEKWWVLHQKSWVEIVEKDWLRLMPLCMTKSEWHAFNNFTNWQPAPDQIYSLPKEVEFEIIEVCKCGECNSKGEGICPYNDLSKCEYLPWLNKKVAHLKESETKLKDFCKDGCEAISYCVDTCAKYLRAKSEEVKKELQTDSDKLELLAAWLDLNDARTDMNGKEVQNDLKRIAEYLRKDSQSEIESLSEKLQKEMVQYLRMHPDKPFVASSKRQYSYHELADEIELKTQDGIENLSALLQLTIDRVSRGKDKLSPKEEEQPNRGK